MKNIFIFIIIIITVISCNEEIPWDKAGDEDFPTFAMIDGKISTDTTKHLVRLHWSKRLDDASDFEPIVGAIITVECNDSITQLTEEEPGYYYTPEDYYGLPGNVYTLTVDGVDTDDDGVADIITAFDSLNEPHKIDSLAIGWIDQWEAWQILVWAPVISGDNYYLFKCYVNDTLVTDSLYEFVLANDEMLGDTIAGLDVYYLNEEDPDEDLSDGGKVTIEVDKITEQAFNFLWQAQVESGLSTPLFSGPPANAESNIVGKNAFGIFMTYSYDRASIYWSDDL